MATWSPPVEDFVEALAVAIEGQESGGQDKPPVSPDGARGPMQIIPSTFKAYAQKGEHIDDPADNRAVGRRLIADLVEQYGQNERKVAAAYFSGSPNPASTKTDSLGKRVVDYVKDVTGRLGVGKAEAAEPKRQWQPPASDAEWQPPESDRAWQPPAGDVEVPSVPMGGTGLPATTPVPRPVEEPGMLARVAEAAKAGFGTGPIGPSEETLAAVRPFGPVAEQAVQSVGTAGDLIGRSVGGAIRGGAAGVGALAEAVGLATPTEGRQLERDLAGMGEMTAVAAPLASPTGLAGASGFKGRTAAEKPGGPVVAGKVEGIPLEVPHAPVVPFATLKAEASATLRAGEMIDPLAKPVTIPNLSRITSTDEARNLITETAQVYQPLIDDARRGVMTHEATRQLADQVGTTPAELVAGWKKGSVLNAEQMLAARDTLVSSAEAVMSLAKEAAAQGPKSTASAELFDMLNAHRAIQETVQGYTAEAGRLLNSFGIMSRDGRTRIVSEAVEASGGQWEEIVRRLAAAKPEEFAGVVRELPNATTMDKLHFGWINGLLSSPTTHMANILGNSASTVGSLLESAVAEMLPGKGVRLGETLARAGGMLKGGMEGFSAAYDALRRGTLGPGKAEGAAGRNAGALGMMLPTRWLGAEDAFFKSIAYRGEIGAQAVRQAKAEGLKGTALAARVSELKRLPSETAKAAAEKFADYQTFQAELGKAGKALQTLRRDMPGGRWLVPFLRTPVNLTKYAVERSPLGAIRLVAPKKFGLETTAMKQEAFARSVVGSTLGLIAADLAGQGKVTGAGPSDPRERGVWLIDHQPFSIKSGDQWISYDRLDPLSLAIGGAADLVYLAEHGGKDATLDDLAADVVGAITRNLTSKTWLQGPVAWLMALADPERYGDRPLESLAASVVPAALGLAARIMDVDKDGKQVARPVEGVFEAVQARIPGLREQLPASVGVLGGTITSTPAFGPLLPQKAKPAAVDPVAEAMTKAEYFPTRPGGRFSIAKQQVELTGKELERFRRDVGTTFRETAGRVLDNPDWFRMSPEAQRAVLERAHGQALEMAKANYIGRKMEPERQRQATAAKEREAVERAQFKAAAKAREEASQRNELDPYQ